jgi:hypothetical protein
METIFYILASILALALLLNQTYRLVLLISKVRRAKYKDARSEFTADLYKLQFKWSERGCREYVDSLGLIIEATNLPEEEAQPKTEYGRKLKQQLTEDEK